MTDFKVGDYVDYNGDSVHTVELIYKIEGNRIYTRLVTYCDGSLVIERSPMDRYDYSINTNLLTINIEWKIKQQIKEWVDLIT